MVATVEGQQALAQIMQVIQEAQKPKPEMVRALVDERVGQLRPALESAVRSVGESKIADIRRLAEGLVGIVKQAEAGLDAKVTETAKRVLEALAPRTLQVVTSAGLELGKLDEYVRPEFDEVLECVAAGIHTLLVGPAGSGKSTFASQLAKALKLKFFGVSMTAGTSEAELIGRFVPIGENGSFKFVPGPLYLAFKNGGLFLLDEIDAGDPNVIVKMNAGLANGWLATPNPDEPFIEAHPNFRCIAAANTWGSGADRQYVGRNQLDAATLDRFCAGQFELDYDVEYEKRAGHPEVVDWAHNVRQIVRDQRIRRVVGTRIILGGTKRLQIGHTLDQVKKSFFQPWTEAERRAVGYAA